MLVGPASCAAFCYPTLAVSLLARISAVKIQNPHAIHRKITKVGMVGQNSHVKPAPDVQLKLAGSNPSIKIGANKGSRRKRCSFVVWISLAVSLFVVFISVLKKMPVKVYSALFIVYCEHSSQGTLLRSAFSAIEVRPSTGRITSTLTETRRKV